MEIRISAPPEFRFKRTVLSHGWSSLPPFELDHENWVLSRVLDVGLSQPVSARISEADEGLHVEVRGSLSRKAAQEIARQVRHIFRLDDALGDFYSLLENETDFAWVASSGAGRMIRSPTVFEDLIKTIC